jgi:hypothetical protein
MLRATIFPLVLLSGISLVACNDNTLGTRNAAPEATISYPATSQDLKAGLHAFMGLVTDQDDDASELTASWKLDGEEVCPPLAVSEDGDSQCEIFLEEGEWTVTLEATDPQGDVGLESLVYEVQPYGEPWAVVESPEAGGVYYSDQLIEFSGQVGDEADAAGDLTAWWDSNVDGEIEVEAAPDSNGEVVGFGYLTEGEHAVTLHVQNSGLNTATASVIIEVGPPNTAPDCEIVTPGDGSEGEWEDVVTFEGTVSDGDVPADWLDVTWTSDWDGELGSSTPETDGDVRFSTSSLSVNTHIITLQVSDELGATCTDSVQYTVMSCPDPWYFDADGDGYGDPENSTTGCEAPSGYVADGTDCDDGDAAISPAATEVCNDVDDDCDGFTDDDDSGLDTSSASMWYADADGDGYGYAATTSVACDQPLGAVADATDCDDADAAVNPAATEVCNDLDDDCDGLLDDDDSSLDISTATTWYPDADADGYGEATSSTVACDQPSGSVSDGTDCDDTSATTYPGADEYCDGVDTDCDGTLDEPDAIDASTWYADADGDGHGDPLTTDIACTAPSGYLANDTDCDDTSATTYPGADEYCDGVDTDCDGTVDEDDALDVSIWYADSDGDGYGDPLTTDLACTAPSGFGADDTDCDDSTDATFPGAVENCDGVDTDCDGTVDEVDAVDAVTWYGDTDGDGFGDPLSTDHACSAPTGYVGDDTDCDDTDSGVHPGADEYCDGVDTDCDGVLDEDDAVDTTMWYMDYDGDGYGGTTYTSDVCTAPAGYVSDNTDCDDTNVDVWPGADEACNGIDDDCDASVDEDDSVDSATWYSDGDGDGYGDPSTTTAACEVPSGHVADSADCDDGDGAINPGASEVCDDVDNDCNGLVDDDDSGVTDALTWYLDSDADSYGDAAVAADACDQPGGYVADDTDCDDADADVHPGSEDFYDGIDDDCDGDVDEILLGEIDLAYSGARLLGENADDTAGYSVAGAGDVDGDGFEDLLVGAPLYDSGGDSNVGIAYLVRGPVSGDLDLGSAAARMIGEANGYCTGRSVASAGDVDGDGLSDILVGANEHGLVANDAGAAYLLLGPVSGDIDLATADARLLGEAEYDGAGGGVAGAGDVDGDGFADLLIGAREHDSGGSNAGAVYLVLGPVTGDLSLASADACFLGGNAGDMIGGGETIAGVGDIDGDGLADVIIGSSNHDTPEYSAGAAYLFYGVVSGDIELDAADASLIGDVAYDLAATSVDSAGDVDGDGYQDLIIGAPGKAISSDTNAGVSYVVLGPVSGDGYLESVAHARLLGESLGDQAGIAVSGVGDSDGDGFADLLVGVMHEDSGGTSAGAAYLVSGPVTGEFDLGSATAKLIGEEAGDYAGASIDGVGDVDGDGLDDILIGARNQDFNGSDAGAAYLFLGSGY